MRLRHDIENEEEILFSLAAISARGRTITAAEAELIDWQAGENAGVWGT